MVAEINREKVRESFHKRAGEYDDYAVVQRRVVAKLVDTLRREQLHPDRLLDIGAGTGNLLKRLRELYPESLAVGADLAFGMCRTAADTLAADRVHLVNADAERLPFASGCFQLVLSTSTYQWLTSLEHAFTEVRRVLSPGGLFCFALFGEKTLYELRDSYKAALKSGPDRSHSFFSAADVQSALERAGFSGAAASSELEVEFHRDVPELLRSLKKIGAGTATPVAAKGLSERRVMLEMMESYQKTFGREEGIPATYEVIYGLGWK
ncbi:malonyl-ACP O-methyltransferase BioC [Geomonas sp.]|uniref:malonyl-ACP O-methyltransferase BioC n=1 Tax=Geomonas sp. TaxID=2651584 RepID=UPI002B45A83B|nr:malonyl-ACP O-methyltransferase BioC [Geomonas sp.]HJV33737.1 malonyl-ACP O-methyltransferase BioC [Geomonas sp.]